MTVSSSSSQLLILRTLGDAKLFGALKSWGPVAILLLLVGGVWAVVAVAVLGGVGGDRGGVFVGVGVVGVVVFPMCFVTFE